MTAVSDLCFVLSSIRANILLPLEWINRASQSAFRPHQQTETNSFLSPKHGITLLLANHERIRAGVTHILSIFMMFVHYFSKNLREINIKEVNSRGAGIVHLVECAPHVQRLKASPLSNLHFHKGIKSPKKLFYI